MPVPQRISDLDVIAANNSPKSSENVGPLANQYFQAAFSFIRQLASGAIFKPEATLGMNGQKIANMAEGDTSSSSKEALTGAQVRALAYKVGEIRMWNGTAANIAKVWGAGWQLADGTNGTPDLRDRFIVGAGGTVTATSGYALGDKGGSRSVSGAQLPQHTHPTTENPHAHALDDKGHGHGVDQQPHDHPVPSSAGIGQGASGGNSVQQSGGSMRTGAGLANIAIRPAATGISVNGAKTGITVNADPNAPQTMDIRPPYYALCYVYYTGIGA